MLIIDQIENDRVKTIAQAVVDGDSYRTIAKREGISAERVRQLLERELKRIGLDTDTLLAERSPPAPMPKKRTRRYYVSDRLRDAFRTIKKQSQKPNEELLAEGLQRLKEDPSRIKIELVGETEKEVEVSLPILELTSELLEGSQSHSESLIVRQAIEQLIELYPCAALFRKPPGWKAKEHTRILHPSGRKPLGDDIAVIQMADCPLAVWNKLKDVGSGNASNAVREAIEACRWNQLEPVPEKARFYKTAPMRFNIFQEQKDFLEEMSDRIINGKLQLFPIAPFSPTEVSAIVQSARDIKDERMRTINEVLAIQEGGTDKEIAERLGVSPNRILSLRRDLYYHGVAWVLESKNWRTCSPLNELLLLIVYQYIGGIEDARNE